MAERMHRIKAKARQLEVERLHQSTGFEFIPNKQITEHADTLPGEHRFYRMRLFAKAQVLHFAGLGHIPPSAAGGREPSLPCRGMRDKQRPVKVNENPTAKVGRPFERAVRGKQSGTANGPERIAEELLGNAIRR